MTPTQAWWVTFWSCKDSMKARNLKTVVWQLESLIKQAKELSDGSTKASATPE